VDAQFDVFIIGTGSAGSSVAFACAQEGLRVAISDNVPFGGTCALRGCDPKKVLVAAEETVDLFYRMQNAGAVRGSAAIDWAGLMKFKRSFTDPVPADRERAYSESKIATFHGAAAFKSPGSIRINEQEIEAEHFVVATGARPRPLSFPGAERLRDSTAFLELEALPKRVVFVGGGYISFEFAHVCARAGSKATIIHRGKRPLERFDEDLVRVLVDATKELGINVVLDAEVSELKPRSGGFVVTAGAERFEADLVFHGAGRIPALSELNLSVAGAPWTEDGVEVDEFLQSTRNPRVYAAGDAARSGGPPLTPIADYTGSIVAANILHPRSKKAAFSAIPSIVFTTPSLAAVGLTQEQADREQRSYKLHAGDSSTWYSARRVNAKTASYKVLVDKGSDKILGAHVLGPGTEELINLFAMAMQLQTSASDLGSVLFAYPTYSSDLSYML